VWEQLSNIPGKEGRIEGRNTRYKGNREREKKTCVNSKNVGFQVEKKVSDTDFPPGTPLHIPLLNHLATSIPPREYDLRFHPI
jgi:hypothetical protein